MIKLFANFPSLATTVNHNLLKNFFQCAMKIAFAIHRGVFRTLPNIKMDHFSKIGNGSKQEMFFDLLNQLEIPKFPK